MLDILAEIKRWTAENVPFALATVIQTWGSAPRALGSMMAITADMQVAGSVSGGCVESDVVEAAQQVLKSGKAKMLGYGVTDETAWSVGLTCGGKIKVFVEPYLAFSSSTQEYEIALALQAALEQNKPAILMTELFEADCRHLLIYPDGNIVGDWKEENRTAVSLAIKHYAERDSQQIMLNDKPIFVQVFPPREKLIIIGASHIAIPLVSFAKAVDLEVIVVDPREVLAAESRFTTKPDKIIRAWPQEALAQVVLNKNSSAVLLTHDPKIDDPALHIFLRSEVNYIGALGSRKTHARRLGRLKEAGFNEAQLAKIKGPAGIDIHAKTPAEIALSIIAEAVKANRLSQKVDQKQ